MYRTNGLTTSVSIITIHCFWLYFLQCDVFIEISVIARYCNIYYALIFGFYKKNMKQKEVRLWRPFLSSTFLMAFEDWRVTIWKCLSFVECVLCVFFWIKIRYRKGFGVCTIYVLCIVYIVCILYMFVCMFDRVQNESRKLWKIKKICFLNKFDLHTSAAAPCFSSINSICWCVPLHSVQRGLVSGKQLLFFYYISATSFYFSF